MTHIRRTIFTVLSLAFLFLPAISSAQSNSTALSESVADFQASFQIQKDASVLVTENISYNFGDQFKHGIFRTIPYKYQRNGLNYKIKITDVKVTNPSGQPYQFSQTDDGSNITIKIGDPNSLVGGILAYHITYKVRKAVNFFDDHDEFYWNVTGDQWLVPIKSSSATVSVSGVSDANQYQLACFVGLLGSTADCNSKGTAPNIAVFSQTNIGSGIGFTVVVGWPKGLITKPTWLQELGFLVVDNLFILIPFVVFIIMFFVWFNLGRDPKSKIPVVAQYEAPDGLTPIEVGYLMDERNQNSEITSEIIYLATLGYLKIERIPKNGILSRDDYKLIRIKQEDDKLKVFDRLVMKTLFVMGPDEVLLSSLSKKSKMARDNFELRSIGRNLTQDGYYVKDPFSIRLAYVTLPAVAVFIIAWLASFNLFSHLAAYVLVIAVSMAIIAAFGYFMPRKTQKGADAKNMILGLREYLLVAEKDRLDFHNDPVKDPKTFEKLLPYALALGVSKAWAKKFEGIYNTNPSWYSDPTYSSFNSVRLASNLSMFNSSFTNMVITNNSRSGGSGGSGFGGGGFSGGGMGGGGGGSW